VLVVLVHGSVLPVRILQVTEVVFCYAPLVEPFPLLADVVLLLAYANPPHDATDLQFLSAIDLASGLEGPATSPFDPLPCCHYLRYSLWIPFTTRKIGITYSQNPYVRPKIRI